MAKKWKLIAPDGGWGWFVVLGVSLINISTRAIETSFGLLFSDQLAGMGVATTGAAIIMSTLDSIVNMSGFLVGPLCSRYSFRKVAAVGSCLSAIGLIATFNADSMKHILTTYSIIGGLGTGLASSSTFVILNHYFDKKKAQAVGLSMVGTAVGQMLFPQAVRFLLEIYDFQGAILILGGIALHSLVGTTLLQPVKWHLKKEPIEEIESSNKNIRIIIEETEDDETETAPLKYKEKNVDALDIKLKDIPIKNMPIVRRATVPSNLSDVDESEIRLRKTSVISNMDLTNSSLQIYLERTEQQNSQYKNLNQEATTSNQAKRTSWLSRLWKKTSDFFDFDLLNDKPFLNILFGLSLVCVAEQNFKMVTPFFFASLGFSKSDIAMCLSLSSSMDILSRIIIPPVIDKMADRVTKRTVFILMCFLLGLSRIIIALQTGQTSLTVWYTISGFFRGAAFINVGLCVSEHCTLEKLPAAFGLHMVAKGLFVICFGPLLGVIRDTTGSYLIYLNVLSALLILCSLSWLLEYFCIYWKRSKANNANS